MSLSDILGFFTGADHPPPCGFPVPAALYFNNDAVLATASTCAITLTLPTKDANNPTSFREKLLLSFKHNHFGRL